jgi:hypothetical protein
LDTNSVFQIPTHDRFFGHIWLRTVLKVTLLLTASHIFGMAIGDRVWSKELVFGSLAAALMVATFWHGVFYGTMLIDATSITREGMIKFSALWANIKRVEIGTAPNDRVLFVALYDTKDAKYRLSEMDHMDAIAEAVELSVPRDVDVQRSRAGKMDVLLLPW